MWTREPSVTCENALVIVLNGAAALVPEFASLPAVAET